MNTGPCAVSKGVTKSRKTCHRFIWIVENFDTEYGQGNGETNKEISSPVFKALHPDGRTLTSWIVDLVLVDSNNMDTYLRLSRSDSLNKLELRCKFSIHVGTEARPKILGFSSPTQIYRAGHDGWGWQFATLEKLRSRGLLAGDRLQVYVRLTIFAKPDSVLISTNAAWLESQPVSAGWTFESLLGAWEFSDIKILRGTETFPAHKAILAGQSAVFKAMLLSDMEEVKSNSREKYELMDLKHYCFRKLVTYITAENAGALAVAAYLYAAEENVKITLRNFFEPRFFELVKSQEFKALVQRHNEAFF